MSSRPVKNWGCGGRGFIRKNIDNLRVHARPLTQHLNPVEHVNIYDYDSIGPTLSKHGFEWIGTDRVMAWANCPIPFSKNTRTIIRFFTAIEWVISRLDRNRELDIKVYASKPAPSLDLQ